MSLITSAARRVLQSEAVQRRVRTALDGPSRRPARPGSQLSIRDVRPDAGVRRSGPDPDRARAAARARRLRAEELSRRADEATQRLHALERSTSQAVQRTAAEVAQLKADVAATRLELVERARSDAMGRVEEARRRTEELAERASLHVAEVERRAEITARRLVAEAEARLARVESQTAAELERARIAARTARAQAETAATQALDAAHRAPGAPDRLVEGDAPTPTPTGANGAAPTGRRTARPPRGLQATGRPRRPLTRDLHAMDDVDLYLLAKERGVEGRADLSRDELLIVLERAP